MKDNESTIQAVASENKEHVSEAGGEATEQSDPGTKMDRAAVTTLSIDSIVVENRYRKNLGDLAGLKDSINKVGLLHPIVVTADGKLVAGKRRLEACKQLGWDEVPVHIIGVDSLVQAEYDENVVRLEFSPLEALAIAEALTPIEREKAEERKKSSGRGKQNTSATGQYNGDTGGKLPPGDRGKARDKAAAATGYSATSIRKIREMAEAAKGNPDCYTDLISELETKRRIEPIYKKFKQIRGGNNPSNDIPARSVSSEKLTRTDPVQLSNKRTETSPKDPDTGAGYSLRRASARRRFSSVPVPTRCDLIMINAPWEKGNPTSVSPMSADEISVLPVQQMADENCILLLRAPNAHLSDAYVILKTWGFVGQDVLTWVKPEAKPGEWLLNQTEHFVLATKGNPVVDKNHQFSSALSTSQKTGTANPSSFHKLVEEFCPAKNRVELFASTARSGWSLWPAFDEKPASRPVTSTSEDGSAGKATLYKAKQNESTMETMALCSNTSKGESSVAAKPVVEADTSGRPVEDLGPELATHEVVQYLLPPGQPQGQSELIAATDQRNLVIGKTDRQPSGIVDIDTEPIAAAEGQALPVNAMKPDQVTLAIKHMNGTEQKSSLSGADVPDPEDWQQLADELYDENEKSKDGPPVLFRMIDEMDRQYLQDVTY